MYLKTQIENLIRIAQEEESYEPIHETLEKITLTGAEYFDLGYKLSDFAIGDTIRFEGIIKGTDASTIPSSGSQLIFSLGNDGGQWLGKAQNGTKYAFGALSSNQSTIDFNEEVLADVTITLSGNASKPTFTITGSVTSDTETSTIAQRSATPTYYDFPLLFGAGTKSTGEKSYGGDYTIKCGKIYINGTMTKDYVPALDSQIRPCLYDKISKTFTYAKKISDGTETYDLGFKRWNKYDVDYIESSGTQYINTGYNPTKNTSFDLYGVDMDYASGTTRFGSRTGTYSETFVLATIADSHFRWSYGTGTAPATTDNVFNTQKKAKQISWDATTKRCTITFTDDTTETSVQMRGTDLTSSAIPIYLFAFNSVGEAICGVVKHTRIVFREGDVITRDFKPSVWHNGDTTAVACLYDEVYNKMYQNAGTGSFKAYITNISTTKTNVFTTTGATSGKAINAEGQIINSSASSYSALLPIVGGTVIECVSGDTGNNNYRFHCYDSSGTWIEQSLVLYPEGAGTVSPITGSFTAPINAKYVRVSYATQASSTIQVKSVTETIYEVGMYIRTVKTSTQATIGPIIELGEYPQDGMGYHIKTTTNSASSNYLFGSRITTGENLQIVTLSGSQTGGTILSTVMGESMTWKSGTTTWVRSSTGTTYECSIQTYKDGNTYKFNAIGYNYTLGKEADRQTQTYTNPIGEQQDAPMLCFGAFNTANILFGTNSHYFVEWNLPNVRHTLLPVINTAHTQFCFIDNKTKEIYEFTKVGSYAPTTNNISFKQLDGTVVTGTLT